MSEFFASYNNVINLILLNSIIGYGVWLVLIGNMFSMATGGFLALGAYFGVYLTTRVGLPFPLVIAAGGALAALAALVLGAPLLRLRGDYFALATLAFTEVVRVIALNWDSVTGGALGIYGIPRLTETSHLAAGLGVMVFVGWALMRSHTGRAVAAIRADEVPAAAMGVNVFTHRLALFVASGGVCGVAGALAGHLNFFIGPGDFGLMRTVDAVAYPILGGIGSIFGPVVGALTFTILPELFRFSNQLREVMVGGLLLAAVLFVPNGLTSLSLSSGLGPTVRGLLGRRSQGATPAEETRS